MTDTLFIVCKYFIYFLFYSTCGWALEVIYCMIVDTRRQKKFTISNRGFLNGPLCPIYGFTATAMAIFLQNFTDNLFLLCIVGIFVADTIEYLTSYIMEKIFNARWWDYRKEFLNINGRICLKHSILWGFLSVVFMKFIHPIVTNIFSVFGTQEMKFIALAFLFLFIYDLLTTLVTTIDIRTLQSKLRRVKTAFSGFGYGTTLKRSDIPTYATEFRKSLKLATTGRRRSRLLHLLHQYPEILRLMHEEIDEIQSVPSEYLSELKFLQMDLDTFINSDKTEMH